MYKIILFGVLVLLYSSETKSQKSCDCFDRLSNLGHYYESINKYDSAISAYKDALKYQKPASIRYYHFVDVARNYYKINNLDSSLVYFGKALSNGYDTTVIASSYSKIVRLKKWALIKSFQSLPLNFNWNVYNEDISQLALDQSIRGFLDPINWKNDSISNKINIKKYLYYLIDSTSFEFMQKVFYQFGYPNYSKVGFDGNFSAYAMHITANSDKRSEDYINKLLFFNSNCDYPEKSEIFFYKERKLLFTEGYTLAGVPNTLNKYSNIKNVLIADSLRIENNCLRLSEDSKIFNQAIPDNYIPMQYPNGYFCTNKYKFF